MFDPAPVRADLPDADRRHPMLGTHAAKRLTDLREAWLNTPEWCGRVPEVVPLGMAASP